MIWVETVVEGGRWSGTVKDSLQVTPVDVDLVTEYADQFAGSVANSLSVAHPNAGGGTANPKSYMMMGVRADLKAHARADLQVTGDLGMPLLFALVRTRPEGSFLAEAGKSFTSKSGTISLNSYLEDHAANDVTRYQIVYGTDSDRDGYFHPEEISGTGRYQYYVVRQEAYSAAWDELMEKVDDLRATLVPIAANCFMRF